MKPVKFSRSQVRFICEQDGASEQELKRKLTDFFQNRETVTKAYLAAVEYGTSTITVALCLRVLANPDTSLVESIGDLFASIFSPNEHLDILFLDDAQERQLTRVCRAFYEAQSRK